MFLGQIHLGKSFDILYVGVQQTLVCWDEKSFEIDSRLWFWTMSLVESTPKVPSRRRAGKGRSPRQLKRRAPPPPGKVAEELKKVLEGKDVECWYQNYQRPPRPSTEMKEKIQQFSQTKIESEKTECPRKIPLPKPKLSVTPTKERTVETKVLTSQIEVTNHYLAITHAYIKGGVCRWGNFPFPQQF